MGSVYSCLVGCCCFGSDHVELGCGQGAARCCSLVTKYRFCIRFVAAMDFDQEQYSARAWCETGEVGIVDEVLASSREDAKSVAWSFPRLVDKSSHTKPIEASPDASFVEDERSGPMSVECI